MHNTRLALMLLAAGGFGMYREGTPGVDGATPTTPAEPPIPEGMRGQMFHFRKEKVKDEEGKEIEVFKLPSAKIPLPIPTREQVREIFNDDTRTSEQKFVLDLIDDAFYAQARDQINEFRENNPGKDKLVTADVIDYSKLTINALANMPASERGNKVSDEDMAEFIKDYVAIMPQASGKDANKVKAQAGILEKGLRTVKTDKKVLGVMQNLLTVWAASSEALEEHQQVYDMLSNRIKKWLSAEPKNVLESIM